MKDIKDSTNKTGLSAQQRELLAYLLAEEGVELDETSKISKIKNLDEVPLSFAQQQLWFLDQLQPRSSAYNIPVAIHIEGRLNAATLEQSLNKIVQRHEVLRTTFMTVDEQPVQVIHSAPSFVLPIVDLQQLPKSNREAQTLQLAAQEAQQPFDLKRGPLLRAKLLRLAEQEHTLLLTMHHIVSDGWSLGVLVRELATLYDAFANSRPTLLPQLPIQYADYAVWQRQWLQGEVIETQLSYWKQQLGGSLPILQLPTDRPRPAVQTFHGARQALQLSKSLLEAIADLSQQEGTTLFMTVLTAFKILLYRYTGQQDILVGSPVANRNQVETEDLIGFFINSLVLRTNLGGNPTFRELLGRVRKVVLEAYNHQDLPFEKLVETLQVERDLSHTPLFQVMFALQNAPMPSLEFSGLKLSPLEVDNGTAKFDLTLDLEETANGIKGWLEYNTDLFDASTIRRMAGHFQTLLEGIVANPQQQISQLPLLTEVEQRQLLVEWNDTQVDYPLDKCIHQLFEEQVQRTPNAVAVVFENQQLTYHQLNSRANQLAHYLKSLGVGADVLVGICVERSLDMVVGLLGILKAGGAYVPLDPEYPTGRLSFMLEDAQVSVLLTQQRLVDRLPQHQAQLVCLDTDWLLISQSPQNNPITDVQATNLAYVIYTSGSTGRPKGTMILHQGVVNYLSWCTQAYAVADGDGAPVQSSFAFDATITSLFSPLIVGKQVILLPEQQEIEALCVVLQLRRFSLVKLTPAHLELLNQLLPSQEAAAQTKALVIGGEPLFGKTLHFWRQNAPNTRLINEYGPTETVVGCSFYEVKNETSLAQGILIGRPIANTQIYILDSYLQPVPVGVPGELHIAGVGLARGYLNRPELTQEKFIPNPFSTELYSRLYKTGDSVRYLADGNIEYIGRIDHQVKIRGFRIELGEIEAVLAQHPAVRATVVMAREDVPGDKRLVTYVVPNQEQAPTVSELRSFLKERLPDYMVPSAFVFLETLPLTPNGKINRHQLPIPDNTRPEWARTFVAPRNSVEEMLAQIWAEILEVKQVSIDDNFFELGGHSLLATQLISRVQKTFQVELSLRSLFEAPMIADLAVQIVDKQVEQVDNQKLLDMLAELEQLSNDEVQKILSTEK
ncbi:MAG: amino acid adenylation domain-containing protein [Iphinoe sp. HA4291-MV1]|jgi:amino acid adenylation domain-containing protein|nr:amino acid adenylation domain-containing protein [Iphinoe sp. HA4291-MV1]